MVLIHALISHITIKEQTKQTAANDFSELAHTNSNESEYVSAVHLNAMNTDGNGKIKKLATFRIKVLHSLYIGRIDRRL